MLPGMVEALRLLMRDGDMAPRAPEPLARLILAARNDAAMSIAHAADPAAVQDEISDALISLFEGLLR